MSDIMKETLEHKQLAHLEALQATYDRLLATHGFDGALIYSGHPQRHFADDQHADVVEWHQNKSLLNRLIPLSNGRVD